MADKQWAQELEEALSKVSKPRPKYRPAPVQIEQPKIKQSPSPIVIVKRYKPKNDTGFTLILFFVFLALAAGLAVALRYKNILANPFPQAPVIDVIDLNPVQPVPPIKPNTDAELRQKVDVLSELTDKIWKRVQLNTDRVTLAGTLLNNNFLVTSNGQPRSKYVYINKDWTIDKMPDQLTLDAEDKEFLREHLNHGESNAIRSKE